MKSHAWMWTILVSSFAALAMPAQARVVYTPVNVYLPTSGSYPIDLNHDGITDFTLQISHTIYLCNFGRYAYRNTLNVQPSPAGGIVGFNWASALQSGVQIDFHQSFYGRDDLMYDVQQSIGGPCRPPHMYGYWIRATQLYLGLEFQINGQTHYGWAELSTNATIFNPVNFLYGFAYETIPLKRILTGQTMDSPDEPDTDSGSGESKVPGPAVMAAQDNLQDHKSRHHQYKLIDTGTLGGAISSLGFEGERDINNRGTVVSLAETQIPDPFAPNCFFVDCFVGHAVDWRGGVLTDLGALPPVNNSGPIWISDSGLVAGFSENGLIDPLTGNPEFQAVLFNDGSVIDLGTLGGNESSASGVNDRGQAVGCAANAVPDSFGFCLGVPQQSRAFIWQGEGMRDLGTLGGPDALAELVNDRGQVAGWSLTDSIANPATGIPTQHPFLWENGRMKDLGTIGGTAVYLINNLNERGQIVGGMNVAGDQSFHPFIWDGASLRDLGTLGGDFGSSDWINETGQVVGWATTAGNQALHAFLWSRGVMTDLGVFAGDQCSVAYVINSGGQTVGTSDDCSGNNAHALLWENGSMSDLNTLIPAGSGVQLTVGLGINERGQIAAQGLLPNGDIHAFLLIPCDERHPGECEDYSMIEAPRPQIGAPTKKLPVLVNHNSESLISPMERLHNQMRQRYHLPGQPSAPHD